MSTDRKISSISIIIPTCNEAENLSGLLPELLVVPDVEILVVDGNSSDDTVNTATALGVKVLSFPPDRALQMNAGAQAARSEILLFLHGDTRLPQGFTGKVLDSLNQPGIVAGAFSLKIDGKGYGLRIIERLVNFRSRFMQLPYGDQGIFVKAAIFSAVGGFPVLPILEDFELTRKLKRKGRIKILNQEATTSARRWKKLGLLRTTFINQAVIIGYLLGVDPRKLAEWYRKER